VRTDYLLPDDFYDFDEVACRLLGHRSGKTFSLGDRVKVEVLQVSVARRRIELRLFDGKSAGPRRAHAPRGRNRGKPGRGERRRDIRGKNQRSRRGK